MVAMTPILQHFNHERHVVIGADVTEYVSTRVSFQYHNEGVLHYVAYYFKKQTPAEWNYDIYHHHLVAMIEALEERTPECEGATHPFQLLTDHRNLQYFMIKLLLNPSEAHWSMFLTRFENQIIYRAGKCL